MKKLFVLLMAAGILVACNNNPLGGKKNQEGGGGLFGGNGGNNNNNGGNTNAGWSTQDRNKFMNDCTTGMAEITQDGKNICSCVLDKMEKQYTSLAEADRVGGRAAGDKAVRECMQNTGGNVPTPTGGDDYNPNPNINEPVQNGGWTMQQKQTFVGQCVPAAQQAQGLNAQQATSYCECMTNKVAAKFSYAEANKLTGAEFQKPEWIQAMMDCRPNADY